MTILRATVAFILGAFFTDVIIAIVSVFGFDYYEHYWGRGPSILVTLLTTAMESIFAAVGFALFANLFRPKHSALVLAFCGLLFSLVFLAAFQAVSSVEGLQDIRMPIAIILAIAGGGVMPVILSRMEKSGCVHVS